MRPAWSHPTSVWSTRPPTGQTAPVPTNFVMKTLGPGVTKAIMHRLGGLLVVLSGRTQGRVFVSVLSYQPGRPTSNDGLRRDLSGALSDFLLTATTGWEAITWRMRLQVSRMRPNCVT